MLRMFRKIRADFAPLFAIFKSKVVYEVADIESIAGTGFIKLQVREHPEHKFLYNLVAIGGEATVHVTFTREQFAAFATKLADLRGVAL